MALGCRANRDLLSVDKRHAGAARIYAPLSDTIAGKVDLALDVDPEWIGILRVKTIRVEDHLKAIVLDIDVGHVNLDVPGCISS